MSDLLFKRTKNMRNEVNRIGADGVREYLIFSNFGNSSLSESKCLYPFFRAWTPVKPAKGRKLAARYNSAESFFNPFKDSLSDDPTIIRYKLKGSEESQWEPYNRLISVQLTRCPLDCWHCYLEECLRTGCNHCLLESQCAHERVKDLSIKEEWRSATEILKCFLEQREHDLKNNIYSNVLRITGGEPFLAPTLLLETLEELRRRKLDHEIFVWTETNLVSLVKDNNEEGIVGDDILQALSEYDNFCVHPCFHGLNENNFHSITGIEIADFNLLIKAFERLLNAGIDVYPTFGSNMSSPNEVERFYYRIAEINKNLPLRFCPVEYDLDYGPVRWRRKNIPGFAKKHELVFDRFQNIERWDTLLQKHTGYKYGELPRHFVSLK